MRSRFLLCRGGCAGLARGGFQGHSEGPVRAGATEVPVSNTKPRASPSIGGPPRAPLVFSPFRTGDLFPGRYELEDRSSLLLVVADDAGAAGHLAEGVFCGFFRVFRLQAMTGLALDIGVIADIGGVEEGFSIAQCVATDTVVARLVTGFFQLVDGV